MQFQLSLKAGQWTPQSNAGRAFLLLSTGAAADIEVRVFNGTAELEHVHNAARGFKFRTDAFTRVEFKAAIDCTVKFVIGDGTVDMDFLSGSSVQATLVGTPTVHTYRGEAPGAPLYVSGLTETLASQVIDGASQAVTDAGVQIAAANPARFELNVINDGPDPVAIGGPALTWATRVIVLEPGDTAEIARAAAVACRAITAAGKTATVRTQEVLA